MNQNIATNIFIGSSTSGLNPYPISVTSRPTEHAPHRGYGFPFDDMVSSSTLLPKPSDIFQHPQMEYKPIKPRDDAELLVNSSLMFFSSRPDSESLRFLAASPKWEGQALEILLRNWKSGGEYMRYLEYFASKEVCCASVLVVNSNRWWSTDGTLFDLVDQLVPQDEQGLAIKTLLNGDLRFRQDFPRLKVPWADAWREACQHEEWSPAKGRIIALGIPALLKSCAVAVIAEHQLQLRQQTIEAWRIGNSMSLARVSQRYPIEDRLQYLAILKDCSDMGSQWVSLSWYEYGNSPWMR